jgi:hypothetical protein
MTSALNVIPNGVRALTIARWIILTKLRDLVALCEVLRICSG